MARDESWRAAIRWRASGQPHRPGPRDDDGEHRGGQGGKGDRQVEAGVGEPRDAVGRQRQQRRGERRGECQAGAAADDREHRRFHQPLPRQRPIRRPHRQPDSVLAPGMPGPRDDQPGHIDAGDEQQHDHRPEQRPQGMTGGADDVRDKRRQRDPAADLRSWPALVEPPANRREVVGGRRHGDAVAQAADQHQDADVGKRVGLPDHRRRREAGGQRRPELGAARVVEARRHHPDHRLALAVESDGASDDRRVTAEAIDPGVVAEHEDIGATRHVVMGLQRAPEHRPDPERVEERTGDAGIRQARRVAVAFEHGRPRRGADRGHRRDGVAGGAERCDVAVGELDQAVRDLGGHAPTDHQAIGVANRLRCQQHGVDGAEHRRGRADAQRQRDDRGQGVAGVRAQMAEGQPQIGTKRCRHGPMAAPSIPPAAGHAGRHRDCCPGVRDERPCTGMHDMVRQCRVAGATRRAECRDCPRRPAPAQALRR